MKKYILLALLAFSTTLFYSCDEGQDINTNAKVSTKDGSGNTPIVGGNNQNTVNPYEWIGVLHNDAMAQIYTDLSNQNPTTFLEAKNIAILSGVTFLQDNMTEDDTVIETLFNTEFDNMSNLIENHPGETIDERLGAGLDAFILYINNSSLSQTTKDYLLQIEGILYDPLDDIDNYDYNQIQNNLENLFIAGYNNISDVDERNDFAVVLSVARNSYDYWYHNSEDWETLVASEEINEKTSNSLLASSRQKRSMERLSDLVASDAGGAIAGLLVPPPPAGSLGGAVGASAASAISSFFDIIINGE